MSELENLNMGELCVHYKVCRIKPCHAHCGEYLPKDYLVTDRPNGKWIFKHNSSDIWCSNCDENFDEIPQKFLFCPNCGADMRGDMDG